MDENLQQHIAFYLTGRQEGSNLQPMDSQYRPALFARYGDLSTLRYDFPLVLNRDGSPERAVLSLSRLVDEAVEALGENPDRDRIAHHGYGLERELRRELAATGAGDFATLWEKTATRLAGKRDETVQASAKRLWSAFRASGDLVDADSALPALAFRHAWSAIQASKAKGFRQKAERLLLKLRDILVAEMVGSAVGRTPERLRSGVGSSFEAAFDFDAMSRILVEAKPGVELIDERRKRIHSLIDVLEKQRFYPLGDGAPEPYNFAFVRCSDALEAYQERHEEAVELAKTLAIAELETNGDYRESVHNVLFEGFGANGLDADELAQLPDYLVCTDGQTLDPAETAQMVELLAAGLPIKVLVQTDDVLEPSAVAEGHLALGLRAHQLVDSAIGLTDVFVFQSSASQLFRKRDSLLRGLRYNGPALFSVFSGVNGHTGGVPAYLVAAAAMESRVFPALVYDPSAGSDWATRLGIDDNPRSDDDWPVHNFGYEEGKLQAQSEELAFTLADFMAMDERFFRHYAIVPKADWSDALIPVPEALQANVKELPDKLPYVTLVDDENRLQRAILDDRTLLEVRRCRTMWHSLQELGGIHNSHAERLLAQEREAQAAASLSQVAEAQAAASLSQVAEAQAAASLSQVAELPVAAPAESESGTPVEVSVPEPVVEESHGDDPYIETARCTTCNECTELNSGMFAYNENKQAYIADPDAGSFRQMVEAAETCQVAIIHPGKPRDPKEPGLDDLNVRAAEFN